MHGRRANMDNNHGKITSQIRANHEKLVAETMGDTMAPGIVIGEQAAGAGILQDEHEASPGKRKEQVRLEKLLARLDRLQMKSSPL
jgi:hypothetical protein